jgi:hypothetical protein
LFLAHKFFFKVDALDSKQNMPMTPNPPDEYMLFKKTIELPLLWRVPFLKDWVRKDKMSLAVTSKMKDHFPAEAASRIRFVPCASP